jgi:hypothetical protein
MKNYRNSFRTLAPDCKNYVFQLLSTKKSPDSKTIKAGEVSRDLEFSKFISLLKCIFQGLRRPHFTKFAMGYNETEVF